MAEWVHVEWVGQEEHGFRVGTVNPLFENNTEKMECGNMFFQQWPLQLSKESDGATFHQVNAEKWLCWRVLKAVC